MIVDLIELRDKQYLSQTIPSGDQLYARWLRIHQQQEVETQCNCRLVDKASVHGGPHQRLNYGS